MIPEFILAQKRNLLAQLIAKRKIVEDGKQVIAGQKIALKKAENETTFKQVDKTYETFKQERLRALEDEIATKRAEFNAAIKAKGDEVAAYKERVTRESIALAEAEAEHEVGEELAYYDKEIEALQKEIGE